MSAAAALVESDPDAAVLEAVLDAAEAEMERRRRARAVVERHLAECQVCAHDSPLLCSQGAELVRWAVG